MTKAELIQAQAAFPDETVVVVKGYESCFGDVSGIELVDVTRQPDRPDHDGYYQHMRKDQEDGAFKVADSTTLGHSAHDHLDT